MKLPRQARLACSVGKEVGEEGHGCSEYLSLNFGIGYVQEYGEFDDVLNAEADCSKVVNLGARKRTELTLITCISCVSVFHWPA